MLITFQFIFLFLDYYQLSLTHTKMLTLAKF